VEALRIRADQVSRRSDGAALRTVVEAGDLPHLPPAVEQAAYRIATEALTNVIRHSRATSVIVRLGADEAGLHCDVLDDGGRTTPWRPGVGIAGMRERVAQLGGTCEVGTGPRGGEVRVCLPIAVV
jgi:two-component system, NarL family, sensor kinase